MSDEKRKLFGEQGDAAALIAQATERIPGQKMSDEQLKRGEKIRNAQAMRLDSEAAAAFTEEIIGYLNMVWNERNFTPEQRIFSIALATINLREQVPDVFPDGTPGTREMFDRVCNEARVYYDANKDVVTT